MINLYIIHLLTKIKFSNIGLATDSVDSWILHYSVNLIESSIELYYY